MTGDIAGHQVRRELDTREIAAEAACQSAHQQGLAKAGNTFEQDVPAANQGGQDIVDHRVLTDHRLLQFVTHGLSQVNGALPLLGRIAGRGRMGFADVGLVMFLGTGLPGALQIRIYAVRLRGRVIAHKAFLRVCR